MLTGLVTPEIAGWLQEMNTGNRPLNQEAVERFRGILRNGQWMNTGEAIVVASNGTLNDGQHRLIAIQSCGIPAAVDVRFGIAMYPTLRRAQPTRRRAACSWRGAPHKKARRRSLPTGCDAIRSSVKSRTLASTQPFFGFRFFGSCFGWCPGSSNQPPHDSKKH